MPRQGGWYSRGYLPHIDAPGRNQFLTWRLADSIPDAVIERWRRELKHLPEGERRIKYQSLAEKYLDEGHGSCALRNPSAAIVVQDVLRANHGKLFELHAWSIMPNHVHVLLKQEAPLGEILKALKGSTSREVNKHLGRTGSLWQEDYFDRLIRDEDHFEKVKHYIEWNPVKAKLCTDPKKWAYSSANPVALAKLRSIPNDRRTEVHLPAIAD